MSIQTVFEVTFKDGRLYRVACNNNNQVIRFRDAKNKLGDKTGLVSRITSGIHTVKEWEQIVENEL